MSWYGKIVGGSLGALFGPVGMIAGASFGHYYDNSSSDTTANQPKPVPMSKEKRHRILFYNTLTMMAKMAKADGYVTEEEVETVQKFMVEPLRLNATSRSQAIKIFNEAKNDDKPFGPISEEFALAFDHDLKSKAMLFEMLLAIALADGILHPNEDRLLLKALHDFKLNVETYENIRTNFLPEIDSLYKILGVHADCSDAEVKKVYRQLSREYHPDTVASANVSNKIKKMVEDKFKEINQAYQVICRLRNIK